MPSKKKAIIFEDGLITRKYKLTDTTIKFVDGLLRSKGMTSKEQSPLIASCIISFYEFYKEHARIDSGTASDKDEQGRINLPDQFSSMGGINVVLRVNSGGAFFYVKLPASVIRKLDEMIDFVHKKYGFKSSSSIVNHAIGFVFEDVGFALEEFLLSEGLPPVS